MADLDPAQELELAELIKISRSRQLKSPSNASFLEKTAEVGRSLGRGVQLLGEAAGDVYDIAKAGKQKEIAGFTGLDIPTQPTDGPGDAAREEFYQRPLIKSLTEEKLARGESTGLDMLKTAAEWAPSVVNPQLSLARNLTTVVTTGIGAGGGEQLMGEAGEVVGGILGAIKGKGLYEGMQTLTGYIRDRGGMAHKRAEEIAANFFRDNASDIDKAVESATEKVALGEKGTTAQLAADTGLFGIEAGANVTPQAVDAQRLARQQRSDQIVGDISESFGPELAPAGRALPRAQQQLETQLGQSDARLSQAVGAEADAVRIAEAQQRQVAPKSQTFEASEELATVLDTSQVSYDKAFKKPAWAEFDKLRGRNGGIETAAFKTRMENYRKGLSPTERSIFDDSYMKEMNFVRELNKTARPSEIAFLISRFKAITGNAARTGNTTATEKFLTEVGIDLEKRLRNTPEAGALYDTAVAATKESTARTGTRALGAERLSPEVETLGQRFVKSGDAGAASANDLASSPPEVIAQTGEYLKSLAAREGLDAKFIAKYEGFLTNFPDQALVTELRMTATADTGLAQARQAVTQTAKEEGAVRQGLTKTAIADFATSPVKTMDNLLSKPDSAARLDELLTSIDSPQAARDAFRQSFIARATSRSGGQNVVNQSAIDEFDRALPALERLFADAPDQLRQLQTVVERTAVENLRKSAPGQRLVDSVSELESLIASGAAATIMTTGNFSGAHNLMMAGALRRAVLKIVTGAEGALDMDRMKIISDMAADPAEFLRIMGNAPKQEGASLTDRATSIITSMIQPGFAGFVSTRN